MDYFPNKIDFYWMQSVLMGILGPFAKYIFPEYLHWPKLVTAILFNESTETIDWGFGASFVAECYINLGIIGVIICSFIVGLLSSAIYKWFVINSEGKSRSIVIVFYVIFLKIFIGLISEGSDNLFSLWLFVIPILSLKWVYKKKTIIIFNT
jgi:oligosaccharide repeat unit polymerase